ncbi:hypothetical protein HM1_0356 [Heliomicrobium modesticaldum Ice1]|uniref:Uncharacterized protein n=1 Tax=Heliobacterium modesticaldum (strain ATCC 51547 / Ice1) TaxID=498761 RepID=B0TEZ2_HELMI|nr:hypothetical protein HM1_0356 [Heliomicrobium modesticaldum Ice1]
MTTIPAGQAAVQRRHPLQRSSRNMTFGNNNTSPADDLLGLSIRKVSNIL